MLFFVMDVIFNTDMSGHDRCSQFNDCIGDIKKADFMISQIKKRVALKLACIIVLVISIIGTAASIAIYKDYKSMITQYMELYLSSAVMFAEQAYNKPLWDFNHKEVARLSRIVLKNKSIVAVNVYGPEKNLINAAEKQIFENGPDTQKIAINDLNKPYIPGPAEKRIVSKDIFKNDEKVGWFEFFYTDKIIAQTTRVVYKKIIAAFLVIATVTIFVMILVLTVFNKPIIEMAKLLRQIPEQDDLLVSMKTMNRADEIGMLYNGFVNMINQLGKKEKERKVLQAELEGNVFHFRNLFSTLQKAIEAKDYSHRLIPSTREDDLTISLNKMLGTLKDAEDTLNNQHWLKNGQAKLSKVISGEQDIEKLANKAIQLIAEYSNTLVGAFYITNTVGDEFSLSASYACVKNKETVHKFRPGEGLPGQAVVQKKIIVLDRLPQHFLKIDSSIISTEPNSLVIIPIVYEDSVKGILELGSLNKISPLQMQFFKSVSETLAAAINAALLHAELSSLIKKLRS